MLSGSAESVWESHNLPHSEWSESLILLKVPERTAQLYPRLNEDKNAGRPIDEALFMSKPPIFTGRVARIHAFPPRSLL